MCIVRPILALVFGVLVGACGLFPDVDETKGWSAEKLYTEAKERLNNGLYEEAIKYYVKLEARYPYGRYAEQAQLEVAYAYYKDQEPAQAVTAAERFIKLHPNHPSVDYAYYLRGLANFNDNLGILGHIGDQDMTERDPKATRQAFDAFRELATRFPDSRYTPDAIARMNYLVNALAAHEIHVARYYMRRGAYVAAANRAQQTLRDYQQTPSVEEALYILAQSYDKLGLEQLRDDAERVMKKNFPESKYLKGAAGKDATWWRLWNW